MRDKEVVYSRLKLCPLFRSLYKIAKFLYCVSKIRLLQNNLTGVFTSISNRHWAKLGLLCFAALFSRNGEQPASLGHVFEIATYS